MVVVGAGLAGLTAAHFLARKGLSVRVLEAADRVGGRMTSDCLGGHVVDRGAQFLSSEYGVVRGLLRDVRLESDLRDTSQCSAVVRGGKPLRVRARSPLDVIRLLGARSCWRLWWKTREVLRRKDAPSLSDYSQWENEDTESVASWSNREFSIETTERFFEPMLQGFFFQTPEETSKALGVVLTGFGGRRARTMGLVNGLGSLPEALAQGVDVLLGRSVRAVGTEGGEAVVHTETEIHRASRVILAVPAPVAQKLFSAPRDPLTEGLLATPYSASLNVACVTDPEFRLPKTLRKAYGLLIPRAERSLIAAVGIENNKRPPRGPGHLLHLLFSDGAARRFLGKPDPEVLSAALSSVEGVLPRLARQVLHTRVYRWPMAEPRSPVGRSAALAAYRRRCAETLPVFLLAGDYMSMPFTEGAAESGRWAAEAIVKNMDRRTEGVVLSHPPRPDSVN